MFIAIVFTIFLIKHNHAELESKILHTLGIIYCGLFAIWAILVAFGNPNSSNHFYVLTRVNLSFVFYFLSLHIFSS